MEHSRETDPASDAMWREFDSLHLPDPDPWPAFEKFGITPVTIVRLRKRGIIVGGLDTNNEPFLTYAEGTPGGVFNTTVKSNPDLSKEERVKQWGRFYNDALYDEDDDHFRAQWPELFTDSQ